MCKCLSYNGLYFLAGAAFWECIIHISLHFSGALPIRYWGFTITPAYNLYVIVGSALICAGLLWFVSRCLPCKCSSESC